MGKLRFYEYEVERELRIIGKCLDSLQACAIILKWTCLD